MLVSSRQKEQLSSRVSLVCLTGRMRALPPLNALRIFEVAARTGSHVGAAAQVGLTHGAINGQVAALEGSIGQRFSAMGGNDHLGRTASGLQIVSDEDVVIDR